MVWRRPGDKLLSESMVVSLLTHICVTRPQWVKNVVAIGLTYDWGNFIAGAHRANGVLWPASWKLFKGSNIHLAKSEMCLTEKSTNGAVKNFHLSKPTVIILLWQKITHFFTSGLRNMVGWRKMNMERKWREHDSWWIRYFNKSIPQSPTPTPTLIKFFGYGHFVSELVDALYSL